MTTDATPPIDNPPVPRPKRGWGVWVLMAICAVMCTGYTWVALTQHEFGTPERDEIPASVRASPGGYRSFHFWHSGYHGGK
jgi:hypothetical protein